MIHPDEKKLAFILHLLLICLKYHDYKVPYHHTLVLLILVDPAPLRTTPLNDPHPPTLLQMLKTNNLYIPFCCTFYARPVPK